MRLNASPAEGGLSIPPPPLFVPRSIMYVVRTLCFSVFFPLLPSVSGTVCVV